MKRAYIALVVALAGLAAGCAAPAAPELTFYADGQSVDLQPLKYCTVTVSKCDQPAKSQVRMPIRPGKPAQISLPSEVADTPWVISVQSKDPDGHSLPPEQRVFLPAQNKLAYTARPLRPTDRLDVIEVDQVSKAMVQTQGQSKPDFLARGIWSVQFTPGK